MATRKRKSPEVAPAELDGDKRQDEPDVPVEDQKPVPSVEVDNSKPNLTHGMIAQCFGKETADRMVKG